MSLPTSSQLLNRNQDSNLGPKPFRASSLSGKPPLQSFKPPVSSVKPPISTVKPPISSVKPPVTSVKPPPASKPPAQPPYNVNTTTPPWKSDRNEGPCQETPASVNVADIIRQREIIRDGPRAPPPKPAEVKCAENEGTNAPEWLRNVKLKPPSQRGNCGRTESRPGESPLPEDKQAAALNISNALGKIVPKKPPVAAGSLTLSNASVSEPSEDVAPKIPQKPNTLPRVCPKPVAPKPVPPKPVAKPSQDLYEQPCAVECSDENESDRAIDREGEKEQLRNRGSVRNSIFFDQETNPPLSTAPPPVVDKSVAPVENFSQLRNSIARKLSSNSSGSDSGGQSRVVSPDTTIAENSNFVPPTVVPGSTDPTPHTTTSRNTDTTSRNSESDANTPPTKVYPLPTYSKPLAVPAGLEAWLQANVLSRRAELTYKEPAAAMAGAPPVVSRSLKPATLPGQYHPPSAGTYEPDFYDDVSRGNDDELEIYDDLADGHDATEPEIYDDLADGNDDEEIYDEVECEIPSGSTSSTHDNMPSEEFYDDVAQGSVHGGDEVYDDVSQNGTQGSIGEFYDDVAGASVSSAQGEEEGEIYEPVFEMQQEEANRREQNVVDTKAEKERKKREEKLRKEKEKEEKKEKKKREKELKPFGIKSDEELMCKRGGVLICKDEYKASKKLDLSYKYGDELVLVEGVACPSGKLLAVSSDNKLGYIYKSLFGMEESPKEEKRRKPSLIPFEEVPIPDQELYEELDVGYRPPIPDTPRPGLPYNGSVTEEIYNDVADGSEEFYDDVANGVQPEELYEPI